MRRVWPSQLDLPSYEEACEQHIELEVYGEDGDDLLDRLGVKSEDVTVAHPVNGPTTWTVKFYPFRHMSRKQYAKWVAKSLRHRVARFWAERW